MDIQLTMQLVNITTNVVSSDPDHGEVYSIQHYVMKFANDGRSMVFRGLRFPPSIKLTAII